MAAGIRHLEATDRLKRHRRQRVGEIIVMRWCAPEHAVARFRCRSSPVGWTQPGALPGLDASSGAGAIAACRPISGAPPNVQAVIFGNYPAISSVACPLSRNAPPRPIMTPGSASGPSATSDAP